MKASPAASEGQWLVPLSDLVVDDEVMAAAEEAVGSGWWSMGPRVAAFEEAFADFCGARHAIAVASGTAALHLALAACDLGPGDEVVVPSLNFVAAANTIVHTGAKPVFCDVVGEHDLNLDPADVERAVGPATKAIVVLHYGGVPCDMDAVLELAGRRGLTVIEDAAHAPGARWRGAMCGTIGRIGCFSFFSNKNLAVGEGGMVVTDDDELAARIRLLRSHGMTTLTWDRHRGHASSYDVVEAGHNFRLDEIRAAIGLVQLGRLEAGNAARGAILARYRDAFSEIPGLVVPFGDRPPEDSAHHLAPVLLPTDVSRDDVRAELVERRIQTSFHYPPIHRFSRYAAPELARPLPQTDRVAARLVTLPLYPHMTAAQVGAVVDGVVSAVTARIGA